MSDRDVKPENVPSAALWDEHGTTLRKQDDCHICGEDEIGSHFDVAWCHACGWRGTLSEHRALVAAAEVST